MTTTNVELLMSATLDYDEALFRLVHIRSYRADFLHGNAQQLHVSDRVFAQLCVLESLEIERRATAALRRVLSDLLPLFPETFRQWQAIMPDDPNGTHLGVLFVESKEYRAHPLAAAFQRFCVRLGCLAPEPRVDSLNAQALTAP